MRFDDLARHAAERARRAASEIAPGMDAAHYRRRRARRSRIAGAVATASIVVVALTVIVVTGPEDETVAVPTTTTIPDTTTVTVPSVPVDPAMTQCRPGPPRIYIDYQAELILERYNAGDAAGLIRIIGDGPVVDPTLRPGVVGRFESVSAWVESAREVGDQLSNYGYGMGEPFSLFVARENRDLAAVGIDRLAVTLVLWVAQDCEVRVEAHHPVSAPDPCRFVVLFAPGSEPGCDGPFDPRSDHVAVWTGRELLIFGGTSGAEEVPLRTGLGFDPETNVWRHLAPAPGGVQWWWSMQAAWVGDRMVVAGRTQYVDGEPSKVVLMFYHPDRDSWEVSEPVPDGRQAVGGLVWTGRDIILAGGDLNYADDTAWAYSPATRAWRRLPDPGFGSVEGLRGVWTGREAIFVGGYAHLQPTPSVAFDPSTGVWRDLAPFPLPHIQFHDVVWTGRDVLVYSGHYGPGHPSVVFRYDPVADAWSESSPMPLVPRERAAGAWSGSHLLIWGGYGTYSEYGPAEAFGDGALYDPESDTWTTMGPSPLTDRCDHSGTWIGDAFVVFGGLPSCGRAYVVPDGHAALYDPVTDDWHELRPEAMEPIAYEAGGYRFEVPATWVVAEESLTPALVVPSEIFSAATFPMHPGGNSCAHVPEFALEATSATSAFVSVQLGPGRYSSLARPEEFTYAWLDEWGQDTVAPHCLAREDRHDLYIRRVGFRIDDRALLVFVALGDEASEETRAQVLHLLNSIEYIG